MLVLTGCQRHEPVTQEDRLRDIQAQIDRKEYNQAEDQLQAILKAEPDNQRARVILASISVNKAGITLKDYLQLEELSRLEKTESSLVVDSKVLEKLKILDAEPVADVIGFLSGLNATAAKAQLIFERFEKIPVVNDEAASHLEMAIEELEKVSAPQTGTSFYRGIIKVFYFRYLWKTDKLLQMKQRKICSRKAGDLAGALVSFQSLTISMVRDVAQGFPKSNERFLEQVRELEENFKAALGWLDAQKDQQKTIQVLLEKWARDIKVEGFKCEF